MRISNGAVVPSRYGAGFEIMIKATSEIRESPHHEEIDFTTFATVTGKQGHPTLLSGETVEQLVEKPQLQLP